MTGAIVIGGTHGTGVATCKENGNWSAPAFVKMNSLSFGAQLGGKSSDVVLFILNTKAKTALKRGRLSLGADASVVAGTFDKSFDTSTHGAVAYNRAEGAFAGASLSGGTLASDDEDTEAFYGKEVDYISLLEGIVPTKQNDEVDRFRALLPM
jgi:lipid-binding SYLF domain-containing protein